MNFDALGNKALAPSLAATTNDVAPILRRHAGSESMLTLAGSLGRLVSSFHEIVVVKSY